MTHDGVIYSQPVGHYTLAGIYLTCGDLVATNLHLRIVLNHQPNFKHALSALKLVRCSLKFKQEQKVLEQKVRKCAVTCIHVHVVMYICSFMMYVCCTRHTVHVVS